MPSGATLALEGIDGQQINPWVRRAWALRAPPELAETAAAASRADLLGLHGVGPRAVRVLDEALGRGESS